MADLVTQLVRKTRAEFAGNLAQQRVNRERFREYSANFRRARDDADYRRAMETVQDMIAVSNSTIRLVNKRARISARLAMLASGSDRAANEPPEIVAVARTDPHPLFRERREGCEGRP